MEWCNIGILKMCSFKMSINRKNYFFFNIIEFNIKNNPVITPDYHFPRIHYSNRSALRPFGPDTCQRASRSWSRGRMSYIESIKVEGFSTGCERCALVFTQKWPSFIIFRRRFQLPPSHKATARQDGGTRCVNLRSSLRGVLKYSSAQPLNFLRLVKIAHFWIENL